MEKEYNLWKDICGISGSLEAATDLDTSFSESRKILRGIYKKQRECLIKLDYFLFEDYTYFPPEDERICKNNLRRMWNLVRPERGFKAWGRRKSVSYAEEINYFLKSFPPVIKNPYGKQ